jgi:hypothetical protein
VSQAEATRINRASQEWFKRPDDERYLTLKDLHEATLAAASRSKVSTIPNQSLVARGSETAGGPLYLEHSDLGALYPTHWSLGQLATISHTPAAWLQQIATITSGPAFAAHAVNLGLRHLADRGKVQLMSLDRDASVELRCLVGPDYGRIYDHEVVEAVMAANQDGRWHIPAASYEAKSPKRATTLYGSDRDVFIFLVDERNPVILKVDGTERRLFRGFMVWNSEVGHHRFGFMTFLYDFICDNRLGSERGEGDLDQTHQERPRALCEGSHPATQGIRRSVSGRRRGGTQTGSGDEGREKRQRGSRLAPEARVHQEGVGRNHQDSQGGRGGSAYRLGTGKWRNRSCPRHPSRGRAGRDGEAGLPAPQGSCLEVLRRKMRHPTATWGFSSGAQNPQFEVAELQYLEDIGEGKLRCLLGSGGHDRERVLMDMPPGLLIGPRHTPKLGIQDDLREGPGAHPAPEAWRAPALPEGGHRPLARRPPRLSG